MKTPHFFDAYKALVIGFIVIVALLSAHARQPLETAHVDNLAVELALSSCDDSADASPGVVKSVRECL